MNTDLKEFPVPVITLAAELDGLTTVPKIAFEYEKFEQFVNKEGLEAGIKRKPVIILHDINHSQYANITTFKWGHKTWKPLEYAFETIADYSCAFLALQLSNDQRSFNKLRSQALQTRDLVKGILYTFRKIEIGGEWCKKSQNVLIESLTTPFQFDVSNVEYNNIPQFTLSNPSIEIVSREQKRVRRITFNLYEYSM